MKRKHSSQTNSDSELVQSSSDARANSGKGPSNAPTESTSILDPNHKQSITQRRKLRSHYHALKASIAEEKEDLLKGDSDKFGSIISKAESLHNLVQRPREQVADAEALFDLSRSLYTTVKRSKTSDGMSSVDFINAMLENFRNVIQGSSHVEGDRGRVSVSWEKIGQSASVVFQTSMGVCTMLGPLDIEPKQKKRSIPRKRSKPTESTKPEAVKDACEAEKSETDKNMAIMFGILKRHKKATLENLVLNRISFPQTVENIFTLSFLVKDGRVEINLDEDGKHTVELKFLQSVPKNAPLASELASGDASYTQFVFRFDFSDWKVMKEEVEKGMELMPHRNGTSDALKDSLFEPPEIRNKANSDTPIRKITRHRGRVVSQVKSESEDKTEPYGSGDDFDEQPLPKRRSGRLL